MREALVVPTVTLDMLSAQFSPPHVVKIDIEGAEGKAFVAAEKLLETRPVLILEAGEANIERVSARLKGHGYRLFDIAAVREGVEIERAVLNTVAIPREQETCHDR